MHGSAAACIGSALFAKVMEKRGEPRSPGDTAAWIAASAVPGVATLAYSYPAVLRHVNSKGGLVPGMVSGDLVGAVAKDGPAHVVESMRVAGSPLRDFLARRGIALRNSMRFDGPGTGPAFLPRRGAVADGLLRNLGVDAPRGAVFVGFSPGASESAVRGVTAHELGHAVRSIRGLARPRLYSGSKAVSQLLGAIGAVRAADGRVGSGESAAWTVATALSSLPVLHEEVQASRLGGRLARLRGLRRLSAFRGIPTYVATAAAPGIAYGARRLIDKARGAGK